MDIETTLTTLQEQTSILAAAQIGQETRLARVEEGFQQIAELVLSLPSPHGAADEAEGRAEPDWTLEEDHVAQPFEQPQCSQIHL